MQELIGGLVEAMTGHRIETPDHLLDIKPINAEVAASARDQRVQTDVEARDALARRLNEIDADEGAVPPDDSNPVAPEHTNGHGGGLHD
jgi:hypothetical protein